MGSSVFYPPLSSIISQSLLKFTSIELVIPSDHLIFFHLFSFCLQSFPASGAFPMRRLSSQVVKVLELELQLQQQSFQRIFRVDFLNWIDWFDLLAVQGSLKSPPAPQLESINSSVLSLLYAPTLTSIHDYWKNHSFDYTDLCWQNDIFAF